MEYVIGFERIKFTAIFTSTYSKYSFYLTNNSLLFYWACA